MNDKNIEEKAKKYIAQIRKDYPKEIFSTTSVIADYKAGYTQAVTDQSNTLTQYKEALRELVDHIGDSCIDWKFGDDLFYKAVIAPEVLKKAKQLLNNE